MALRALIFIFQAPRGGIGLRGWLPASVLRGVFLAVFRRSGVGFGVVIVVRYQREAKSGGFWAVVG